MNQGGGEGATSPSFKMTSQLCSLTFGTLCKKINMYTSEIFANKFTKKQSSLCLSFSERTKRRFFHFYVMFCFDRRKKVQFLTGFKIAVRKGSQIALLILPFKRERHDRQYCIHLHPCAPMRRSPTCRM